MPALSPTMTEGNLAKWLKKEGDQVKSGDVIAEIETDKATMEVEAADEGVLGKIIVAEGTEGVKVGAVVALLLEEGEDASELETAKKKRPRPPSPRNLQNPLSQPGRRHRPSLNRHRSQLLPRPRRQPMRRPRLCQPARPAHGGASRAGSEIDRGFRPARPYRQG